MTMHATELNPLKVAAAGKEFLKELFRHHFGCEGSRHNPLSGMTADDLCQTNPLDMAGVRFVEALLKRFHGEASA